MSIFAKKAIESLREKSGSNNLEKTLTAFDLILIGLGGIIGSGVFVLTGLVAARHSGPSIMLSYGVAGLCCMLVSLAYAEIATMVPTSGSVYSYTYVAFGRIFAWIVSGVVIMEFIFSTAVVASGWSSYVVNLLASAGFKISPYYTKIYSEGGFLNLPAIFIVSLMSFMLYLGTKDSKKLNAALVVIKILAIIIFCVLAVPNFDVNNWNNFSPFGYHETMKGSSILFFSFTGFAIIATAADECKNPKRDITIGLLGSLIVCTLIYIVVGGLATGIAYYTSLDNSSPLAYALEMNGSKLGSIVVAFGALAGLTSVIMMNIYCISRIFYVMARDRMIPEVFAKLHEKYKSPSFCLLLICISIMVVVSLFPCHLLSQLSSMGGLLEYAIIMSIVLVFRFKFPNMDRKFKCPAAFFIIPLSLLLVIYLFCIQLFDEGFALSYPGQNLLGFLGVYTIMYFIVQMFIKNTSHAEMKSSEIEL